MADVLVKAEHVKKYFSFNEGLSRKNVKAVDDVSLEIFRGETLGLVGESGCGKSTLGRVLLRLREKTGGSVSFEGRDIHALGSRELKALRKDMQIVFQDPYACLNPRLTVGKIIAEPLKFHGVRSKKARLERVKEVMAAVSLPESMLDRYPHELSGGQQQRVGIARALVLQPKFIVCDEAVSALDVSVQAQILNLLAELKKEYQLTYLFISHNLAVVHHLCDRVAVMYLGKIVEIADKERLFRDARHPYTKVLLSALLDAAVSTNIEDFSLSGELPDPVDTPAGCRFHPRCPHCTERCRSEQPELRALEDGHLVACHHVNVPAEIK